MCRSDLDEATLLSDLLFVAKMLVIIGAIASSLGVGLVIGGTHAVFYVAFLVPGTIFLSVGVGLGALVHRDEKRRQRDIMMVRGNGREDDTP